MRTGAGIACMGARRAATSGSGKSSHTPHSATLGLRLPDGEMGFPGTLDARVTITLESRAALSFDIRARADRATPCSFTHHGYFRLDDGPDLRHHSLRLSAPEWLEVDADLIPTGRILPATGALDFSARRSLDGINLDHAFCLAPGTGPRPVAWLDSSATGLALCVETTAPGLQLYQRNISPPMALPGHTGAGMGQTRALRWRHKNGPMPPTIRIFPPPFCAPAARGTTAPAISSRPAREPVMIRTLGVCYYPEHWPEELWHEDARRMAEAGLTWVRIGEFAWSRLEPEPGRLDFGWMDRAIATLGAAGLRVVLGTPTATPPRWMLDRHPDMLARDAQGAPRNFGSRRHYCFQPSKAIWRNVAGS
jgi:hypothetical protein